MRILVGLTMASLMAVAAVQAFAPRATPPLAVTRLPIERIHLNSIVRSNAGLVTGGELGVILYSINEGASWLRASVAQDRQALITQIVFAGDGLQGLAVGHEGLILKTADGGLSWKEVAFEEKNGEPFMSAAHVAPHVWVVAGAFGRAMRSQDDGNSWQPLSLPAAVEDKHMNRIVGSSDGRQWLIVGERGLVLRSDDQGEHWSLLPAFYDGSFYNAMALPGQGWLVYGMRGQAYLNRGDEKWDKVDLPVPASFFGHVRLADGRILLVGQGSLMATSRDGAEHFSISRAAGRATLTDIVLNADGTGWIASDAGLQAYPVPTPDQKTIAGAAQ